MKYSHGLAGQRYGSKKGKGEIPVDINEKDYAIKDVSEIPETLIIGGIS